MIIVVCGEDIAASRDYYNKLRIESQEKGYGISFISSSDLSDIPKWLALSPTLFSQKSVYFTEHLNKKIGRGTGTLKRDLESIAADKTTVLHVWEEISARELKFGKVITIKEFKPSVSIFKLLDCCTPTRRVAFLDTLKTLTFDQDMSFIFLMVVRHIRKLILARENVFEGTVQPWQKGKLTSQALLWPTERLFALYDTLFRIDISMKSSATPYTLRQSLDIMAVHFL